MLKREELQPIYDTRASFYGKARIEEREYDNFKAIILYSYNTEVASIEYYKIGLVKYYCNGKYSQTTTRHQKEFYKQNGLNDSDIKNLLKCGQIEKTSKDFCLLCGRLKEECFSSMCSKCLNEELQRLGN